MPRIRTFAAILAFGMAIACPQRSIATVPDPHPYRVTHRGSITLPATAQDRDGKAVEISGLSGITWLGHDRYAAIMDNSDKLILFSLAIARDGTLQEATDIKVVTLSEHHDYEDIAVCPEPLQQRIAARRVKQGFPDPGRCILVCEEDTPAIRAASLEDGSLLGVIPIPELFATRTLNRGLESLDIDPDGRHIWTANEEALPADGPGATATAGTVVRLTRVPIPEPGQHGFEEPIQVAYAVDPPHHFVRVFPGDPLSGVSAIAGLGQGRLLVLERAGCPGLPPFESRIFFVDTKAASDATQITRDLSAQTEQHISKALVWKDQLGCNIEGLCAGPRLGRDTRALVAVADNGGLGTPNQVIGFALEEHSGGLHVPLVALGGGVVAAAVIGLLMYRLAR